MDPTYMEFWTGITRAVVYVFLFVHAILAAELALVVYLLWRKS